MQLCELTLRQWLDTRNSAGQVDTARIIPSGLNIFQQVVRGIEYIHAQKIVHHDIKVILFPGLRRAVARLEKNMKCSEKYRIVDGDSCRVDSNNSMLLMVPVCFSQAIFS